MGSYSSRAPSATIALLVGVSPAAAQIDYRNLDSHRPTRVTDAYPVERYAFELSVPYRITWRGGETGQVVSPHLEQGLRRNLMVGIGAEVVTHRGGSFDEASRIMVGALWNARRETPSAPALSFALEAELPFRSDPDTPELAGGFTVLATRSVGRARLHANVGTNLIRTTATPDRTRIGWWSGIAADYTLFRSSTLVVGEVTVEREPAADRLTWVVGVGARRQVTPSVVFLGGVSRILEAGASTDLRIGFSHAFAIAGLMPRGPR